jgi:hypothetical protein
MTRWNSKKTPVAVGTYLKIPIMGDFAHQTIGSDDWFEWLEAEGNRSCDIKSAKSIGKVLHK